MNIRTILLGSLIIGWIIALPSFASEGYYLSDTTIFYLLVTQTLLFYPAYKFSKYSSLSPFVIFYLIMFLVNLMRGIYLNFSDDVSAFKYFIVNVDEYEFEYGALVVLISCFGLALSSNFSKFIKITSTDRRTSNSHENYNRVVYTAVVGGVLLLIVLLLLSTNSDDLSSKRSYGFGGEVTSYGPLRLALNIVLFGLQYIFFMKLFSGVKLSDRTMVLILLFIVLASFIISKRSFILLTFLPIVLINISTINFKRTMKLFSVALTFIVIVAAISAVRNPEKGDFEFRIQSIWDDTVGASMLSTNYGGFISTTVSTSVIEGHFDEFPGKTLFIDPITQFIPRALYPAKSEELGGRIRKIHQSIGVAPQFIKGGLPPGLAAEFWLNAGMFGVFVLSFATGLLFILITKKMSIARTAAQLSILFFVAEVLVFFGFGGHIARVFNFLFTFTISVTIFNFLRLKTNRHQSSNSARLFSSKH